MRKLILRCGLAPGDVVMLTAAVRDLHLCYPGKFITDVRTLWPDLWANNPYVTPLCDTTPDVEQFECSYPLINACDETPYHCLHGFIHFLNQRLRLSIRPTAFRGDLHLSDREKSWYSQIYELTGEDTPFWIVAAGGKYDVTIKWWDSARYQAVINHFIGKIQFVQVGHANHYHPKLNGAIDVRGKTSLRELIRLIYHSDGVLCSVTSLMHLAAAVERKGLRPGNRPCVVVAGAREPAHWEAYPGHQYLHSNDALPCALGGGCWRDRTIPLRDGDPRDRRSSLCTNLLNGIPRCMDMITPEEVIGRINKYYSAGLLKVLTKRQYGPAKMAVARTARNDVDDLPLNIHNAGLACDRFVQTLSGKSPPFSGRGIVICAGGLKYFTCAWVCINMLRRFGCNLPIQVWHLGHAEMDDNMRQILARLDVECVDALELRERCPARILKGWELKPYAIIHSSFREILFLDADNVPVRNPEFLFDTAEFQKTGALFWPDYAHQKNKKAAAVWRSCGLRQPSEPEFESGQIVIDKGRCWRALRLTLWFNENSDFYYKFIHGDKETFHLAFRKLRVPYTLIPYPIHPLKRTMCQHDFVGKRIFQHRNCDKWDLLLCNKRIKGFWFEKECRSHVEALSRVWDGGMRQVLGKKFATISLNARRQALKIEAVMISCVERENMRRRTMANLARTDWGDLRCQLQIDDRTGPNHRARQTRCAFLALKSMRDRPVDYLLFFEDDLDFNRYIRHNLFAWKPLLSRAATLGSIYNPRLREMAGHPRTRSRVISPTIVFGSQAFVISRAALRHIVDHWDSCRGMQDIRISRLAARLGTPILYHAPSLVQHLGKHSIWGAKFHRSFDFDPHWRA